MPEFRSKLEDLMLARELRFPDTAGFKPFRRYFTDESITHPAKANLLLLYYLIKNYTKPGDVILDPMAGTGSTNIIASLLGRHSIYVDIEEKFKKMAEENKRLLEKRGKAKGWIKILCGDARKLSKLLNGEGPGATSVKNPSGHRLSSQPKYSESKENIGNLPHGDIDMVLTSPPYAETVKRDVRGSLAGKKILSGEIKIGCLNIGEGYSKKEENIGNLPHGEIDTIITSPPYSEAEAHKRLPNLPTSQGGQTEYQSQETGIAKLSYGSIDTIITSPPYADTKKGGEVNKERMAERWDKAFRESGESWNSWGKTWKTEGRKRGLEALGSGYSESQDNLGNLPLGEIDTIITSPPYLKSADQGAGINRQREVDVKIGCSTIENLDAVDNTEEYGSLPHGSVEILTKNGKPTYLSEMLKVYAEMFKVLKSKGLAIIIIKPFIRNKQVVDLPWHTWLLLQRVGFKLKKLYKLRLKNVSFWRILYERKHPEVPKIRHEYILVVEKPC